MSSELGRRPQFSNGTVKASLVAVVACVMATDARADLTKPRLSARELPARIAAIVDHVRLADPAIVRDLPAEQKIVQFRN
jgi:hypothetical protein